MLLDRKLSGISVDPLLTLEGHHELNQVFFDDVRVPIYNRIGAENEGWTVAKYLLEFEWGGIAYAPRVKVGSLRLKEMSATEEGGNGKSFLEDSNFRHRLANLEIKINALEIIEKRVMSALSQGQNPGASSSIFKLRVSEFLQEMLEFTMNVLGYNAVPYQPEVYIVGKAHNAELWTSRNFKILQPKGGNNLCRSK